MEEMENLVKIGGSLLTGFMAGAAKNLGGDAMDEAYEDEMSDSQHVEEDVPSHMAHAIGRFLGMVVSPISRDD